jgi:hypothetical protein
MVERRSEYGLSVAKLITISFVIACIDFSMLCELGPC